MLEVNALAKRFGNSAVVDGISFSVAEGEILGFVGPPVF
jgi:ABC-type multidrug transport system ATPase subunit